MSNFPKTREDVFKRLARKLTKAERLELAKATDLSAYHFGLGLWIRNTWCHRGNLEAVFCEDEEERKRMEQLSPLDADHTSEMVLERYQSYLMVKYKVNNIRYEYKGYYCDCKYDDILKSYASEVYSIATNESEGWFFCENSSIKLKAQFETQVERLLELGPYKIIKDEWKENCDIESIHSVFVLKPEEFRRRILEGKYDKSMTEKVAGCYYEVPLYFVTKAWDYILKGNLCEDDFRIENEIATGDGVYRTQDQAIAQNEEIKQIWKELLDIDLDKMDIDLFNMEPYRWHRKSKNNKKPEEPFGYQESVLSCINDPYYFVFPLVSVAELMVYVKDLRTSRENWDAAPSFFADAQAQSGGLA